MMSRTHIFKLKISPHKFDICIQTRLFVCKSIHNYLKRIHTVNCIHQPHPPSLPMCLDDNLNQDSFQHLASTQNRCLSVWSYIWISSNTEIALGELLSPFQIIYQQFSTNSSYWFWQISQRNRIQYLIPCDSNYYSVLLQYTHTQMSWYP